MTDHPTDTVMLHRPGKGLTVHVPEGADAGALLDWIAAHGVPTAQTPGATVLKAARQRLVMRVPFPQGSRIVKLFPLRNPISMLKHRKYAWREFVNYGKARARGIPVPHCDAFLRQRRFGFVTLSGIVIEDLGQAPDALQMSADVGYGAAARACIPAFCALYTAGVNHVDARDENLIFTPRGFRVIDWQYASFVAPRAAWLLEYLAAYFIRMAPESERAALQGAWLAELHSAAGHPESLALFRRRVAALLAARPSTVARLALKPYRVEP